MLRSSSRTAKYPIRAVSKLTGLGIDTLRAWERRHQAVVPARGERGRLYSDADVERLRLLRDAVSKGHTIGQLVALDDADLRGVAGAPLPSPGPAVPLALPCTIETAEIIGALERFDAGAVEARLARVAALLDVRELWRTVLAPLLDDIGARWHDGRASIAQEHLLSASIRNVLGTLLRTTTHSHAPAHLVFATPAGERHEFGTLGAALIASAGGLAVTYLGPDLPSDDLLSLTRTVDTDAVVLGITAMDDTADTVADLSRLVRRLPRDVELWLGGPGAQRAASHVDRRALAVPDFAELERHLARVGARL